MDILIEENTLIEILENKENTCKIILDSMKLQFPFKNIDKLILTDEVYKKNENNSILLERVKNELNVLEYLPDENRTSEEMIDVCIENNIIFFSFNQRLMLKYNSKIKDNSINLEKEQFLKLIKLCVAIDKITDKNLYKYLQSLFDSGNIDIIDFIQLTPKAQLKNILYYLTEKILKGESKEVIFQIKNNLSFIKDGEIPVNIFKRNIEKVKGYKFGNVIKNTSYEKYQELIDEFLLEKGIESFEALKRREMFNFKKEEELIEKILKYYGYKQKCI